MEGDVFRPLRPYLAGMVPRSVDILVREAGQPRSGTASYRGGRDLAWEIRPGPDGEQQLLITGGTQPAEAGLDAALLQAILHLDERQKRNERQRALRMQAWPLYGMPKQGRVLGIGPGGQGDALGPEQYEAAQDLRRAALGGTDFRGMMRSIEDAGFLVRPTIMRRLGEEGYSLIGFRFTRGDITLTASEARISITEMIEEPRAPVLARDGAWLVAKRDAHDEAVAEKTARLDRLRADVSRLTALVGDVDTIAGRLAGMGISAFGRSDELVHRGRRFRRLRIFLAREDVVMPVSREREPALARAAIAMIRGSEGRSGPESDDASGLVPDPAA